MRLEEGLYAALIADSAVNGVISGRAYLEQMPQSATFPAIVFNRISTTQGSLLDEVNTHTEIRMQIDCWADTLSAAYDLSYKVRTLLSGFRGDLEGVAVQGCKFDGEQNSSLIDGDEKQRRVITDFTFWLHE